MTTKIKYNFFTNKISYIQVGGRTKGYIVTSSIELISFLMRYHFHIKYVGATSNLLFAFNYYDGYIVRYINANIEIIDKNLLVGSSVSLKHLSSFCLDNGIDGFNRIKGIPGLVGGSIVNNSSCFNESISDNLISIKCIDKKGEIISLKKESINFSYHKSSLKDICILEAIFEIKYKNIEDSLIEQTHYEKLRKKLQPPPKNTLGSTFRRIENIKLPFIMEKLKIKTLGNDDVHVSPIHSNFLVIKRKISYEKVLSLIEEIREILYYNISYEIELEIEVVN